MMKTYSAKLSVIIPVAPKRSKYLRLVLASLAVQTYPKENWEVIVVTDTTDKDDVRKCWDASLSEDLPIRFLWFPKDFWDAGGFTRNLGAKVAKNPFLIFLDSDVIVRTETLEYYAEGFINMPNRVIVGLYHWLRAMQVTPEDVKERFWDIINEKLPAISVKGPRHNVRRDPRLPFYEKTTPDKRWSGGYQSYLASLTGNIGIPAKILWDPEINGFREDLVGGVDGAFGMELYRAGYTFSQDKRLIAGHLYHPRGQKASSERVQGMSRKLRESYHSDASWMGRSISK